MATVYLHIGMPKTGTTALQFFLWDNNDALKKFGMHYPQMDFRYPKVRYQRNAHFLIAPYVDKVGRTDFRRPAKEYQKGLDELKSLGEKYERLILSDEGIWRSCHNRKGFWQELKTDLNGRGLDLKVILYLRRQDLWFEGYWAQKIKEGADISFEDFYEDQKSSFLLLDHYGFLRELSSAVGRDAVIVRVYEKGQFRGEEGNLYSDFLDIFGCALSDGFEIGEEVHNERYDGAYLEFRRILNSISESAVGRLVFQSNIKLSQEYDRKKTEKRYSYFGPGQQRVFLERFAESNRKTAREFLGRKDGVLFYEKLEELPQLSVSDRELLQATICVYGRMLDHLLEENQKMKKMIEQVPAVREDGMDQGGGGSYDILDMEIKETRVRQDERIKRLEMDLQDLKRQHVEVRENVLLYRAKRKADYLFGKNKKKS